MKQRRTVQKNRNWTTHNEIQFLNGLGTFGVKRAVSYTPEERYELQRAAYRKRVDWADIDREKVLKHLSELLGRC